MITSGTVRKLMLERVLKEACGHHYRITTLDIKELQEEKQTENFKYVVLDFPNIKGSAKNIISDVKTLLPGSAVIGIHFYLNRKLIEPLTNSGLDGYLLYNPTKIDFKNAMKVIEKGQKFLPPEVE